MTYSELKYLNAVEKMSDGSGVKQIELSKYLGVSTVSIYKAMARLEEKNLIVRDENGLYCLTDKARGELGEYMECAKCIENMLVEKCNSSKSKAKRDAMAVACALSDENRKCVLNLMK